MRETIMKRLLKTSLLIATITTTTLLTLPSQAQGPNSPSMQGGYPYAQPNPAQPNIYLTPYGKMLQNTRAAYPLLPPTQLTYPSQVPQQIQPQTQQAPQQLSQQKVEKSFREFSGYLGIATDILPSSVAAQLPEGLTQGILIKEFSSDSPANTSDLKPFDVLVAYGNTKINHPAQFIKLVRDDSPGNKVTLQVVRKGQVLDLPITVGSQQTPNPKEFNGLAIVQAGKNTYTASIRFIGKNGNKQIRLYKGTREDIFQQALQAQDLPPAERQQLLFATRPRKSSNSGFGSFFPFGGTNESGKDWMNPSRFFNW